MPEIITTPEPTPHPDVNAALAILVPRMRAILGEPLVGIYLYGSLAQGGFDPASSDIDLIAVTERAVTGEEFAALGALHAAFHAGDSPWAAKIEAAYIGREALNLPAGGPARYPQLEKDRGLAWEPLEIGWPFQRAILRGHGIALVGPPPATLLAPVPARELAGAAWAIVRGWREEGRADPSWRAWASGRENRRFVVQTLCRCLYTRAHGGVASKPAAARWARAVLEPRWVRLIEQSAGEEGVSGPTSDDGLSETLAFIEYAARRLDPDAPG